MSQCRSCGQAIKWAKTVQGKSIPLDPAPCPTGNLVLENGQALVYDAFIHAGRNRYQSHFASCPNAAKHRKPPAPKNLPFEEKTDG